MKKEKFHIEYVFDKVSKRSLWNHITTQTGLSAWFADDVEIENDVYTFIWDKTSETARVLEMKPDTYIRFRWDGEDMNVYFEFHIYKVELTGDVLLEVTDFAEADEKADAISLWDTQVYELKRTLGAN